MEGVEDSFIAGVADFEQEMVEQHHNETTLFDDDITNALLNGINNNTSIGIDKSNQSFRATDGSRSYLGQSIIYEGSGFLLN